MVLLMSGKTYIRQDWCNREQSHQNIMTAQGQNDFPGTSNNVHALSSIARKDVTNPSLDQWANVFGPSAYNMQPDNNRNRRMGKVQIPEILVVSFS